MTNRILPFVALAVSFLSGCTTQDLTRDLLCDRNSGGKSTALAARCMTAAGIEAAKKKPEKSQAQTNAGKDEGKQNDPRYKDWVP